VWKIVLAAVGSTIILLALVIGAYAVYHDKTSRIADLKEERQSLVSHNAVLTAQVATSRVKLRKTTAALNNTAKDLRTTRRSLTITKRNLVQSRKDAAAANARADANYSSGYSAGNSSGYSSGVSAGIVEGSDELTCSDDVDVTWLPACVRLESLQADARSGKSLHRQTPLYASKCNDMHPPETCPYSRRAP
jgi:cell division protein FtsB